MGKDVVHVSWLNSSLIISNDRFEINFYRIDPIILFPEVYTTPTNMQITTTCTLIKIPFFIFVQNGKIFVILYKKDYINWINIL